MHVNGLRLVSSRREGHLGLRHGGNLGLLHRYVGARQRARLHHSASSDRLLLNSDLLLSSGRLDGLGRRLLGRGLSLSGLLLGHHLPSSRLSGNLLLGRLSNLLLGGLHDNLLRISLLLLHWLGNHLLLGRLGNYLLLGRLSDHLLRGRL